MSRKTSQLAASRRAFTLIEMLIVLGVIGILAGIIISQVANATFETRRIVARQQQVVLQAALNSWIVQSSVTRPLSAVQTEYNAQPDSRSRLTLVAAYLDSDTYAHFLSNTTDGGKIRSDAMKRADQWIELPAWAADSYPRVELYPTQG